MRLGSAMPRCPTESDPSWSKPHEGPADTGHRTASMYARYDIKTQSA